MPKLTTAARQALPKSDFALPGGRFPVNDKNHARAALSRASEGVNAGTLSSGEAAKVRAKADAMLGKSGKQGQALARRAKRGG